jgi:hypothetical protein
MSTVIVPTYLLEEINKKLDEAIENCPQAEKERDSLRARILGFVDENGYIPDIKLIPILVTPEGNEDICGLCGQPGADKIPCPEHWPGERIPDSEFVHAECEDEECRRAHACLTPKQRKATLDAIAGR